MLTLEQISDMGSMELADVRERVIRYSRQSKQRDEILDYIDSRLKRLDKNMASVEMGEVKLGELQ